MINRALICALAMGASGFSLAPMRARPMPFQFERRPAPTRTFDWVVTIDEQPVDLKALEWVGDDLVVGLRDFMTVLTEGRSSIEKKDGRYTVSFDGKRALILSEGTNQTAKLLYGDSAGEVREELFDNEIGETQIANQKNKIAVANLTSLCRLMGITAYSQGRYISLHTPSYWHGLLSGKTVDRVQRIRDSFRLMPELGISPPANHFMMWARPPARAWIQFYEVRDRGPAPLLSLTRAGAIVANTSDRSGSSVPVAKGAIQRFRQVPQINPGSQLATYIAVVSSSMPSEGDALAALRSGELKGSNVCVVAVQQTVAPRPPLFEVTKIEKTTRIAELLKRWDMSEELFRYFNGLDKEVEIPAGEPVVHVLPDPEIQANLIEEQLERADFRGYYETALGDTVEGLAERLNVRLDLLYELNDDVLTPGIVPAPGTVIAIPKSAAVPTSMRESEFSKEEGIFDIKKASLFEHPREDAKVIMTFNSAEALPCIGVSHDKKWLLLTIIDANGDPMKGYARAADGVLTLNSEKPYTADPKAPNSNSSATYPPSVAPRAVRALGVGLRYLGTPYNYGGNSLRRGIDCSHFVSAILREGAKITVPAPVHSGMEVKGDEIVYAKPGGPWHRSGHKAVAPQGSRNSYRLGDRFIYYGKGSGPSGHHVTMYAGTFTYGKTTYKNVIIESCGSKGVTISNVNRNSRIFRYVLRDHALYK